MRNPWPSETFVLSAIRKVLQAKGYKLDPPRSLHAHGVDIKVRHKKYRHYIFVECKGYPKGTYSEGVQRDNYFLTILGQILTRMRQKNAYYAVALPYHKFYRGRILRQDLRLAREWLGLWFFLVKRDGTVLRLAATQKEFREYGVEA